MDSSTVLKVLKNIYLCVFQHLRLLEVLKQWLFGEGGCELFIKECHKKIKVILSTWLVWSYNIRAEQYRDYVDKNIAVSSVVP